jgi:hypothetical protein
VSSSGSHLTAACDVSPRTFNSGTLLLTSLPSLWCFRSSVVTLASFFFSTSSSVKTVYPAFLPICLLLNGYLSAFPFLLWPSARRTLNHSVNVEFLDAASPIVRILKAPHVPGPGKPLGVDKRPKPFSSLCIPLDSLDAGLRAIGLLLSDHMSPGRAFNSAGFRESHEPCMNSSRRSHRCPCVPW